MKCVPSFKNYQIILMNRICQGIKYDSMKAILGNSKIFSIAPSVPESICHALDRVHVGVVLGPVPVPDELLRAVTLAHTHQDKGLAQPVRSNAPHNLY